MKHTFLLLVVLPMFVFFTTTTQAQIITTIAGGGTSGLGDGGPAIDAQLNEPTYQCIDTAGNLYISDNHNYRIRKVTTDGIITTIAGTGITGFSGDSGQASIAQLTYPEGIVTDTFGNVIFVDGNRIRKIDKSGIITTIAGTGTTGYNGDNIAATNAEIGPSGIALDDSGNIFICDAYNNRIRKINLSGIITTVAGTGLPGYNGDNIPATAAKLKNPTGIALDCNNNIFFTDFTHRLRLIDNNGIITTIAGTGIGGYNGDNQAANIAELYYPTGIAIDCNGNLFVSDFNNFRVRLIKFGIDTLIATYAGSGVIGYNGDNISATTAKLGGTYGLAIDKYDNLYIADTYNGRIRYIKNTISVKNIQKSIFEVNIFPNPNFGNLNVNITSVNTTPAIILITDVLGKLKQSFNCYTNKSESFQLDLPPGNYYITIINNFNIYHKQIILIK